MEEPGRLQSMGLLRVGRLREVSDPLAFSWSLMSSLGDTHESRPGGDGYQSVHLRESSSGG